MIAKLELVFIMNLKLHGVMGKEVPDLSID
jgi:hypothetical protein